MIPLTTLQGYSREEITQLVGNRRVYIWGNGPAGRDVLTSLRGMAIPVGGLLHNNQNAIGTRFFGAEILNADDYLNKETSFVIVATQGFKNRAFEILEEKGMKKDEDFVFYLKISRPAAAVDIAGVCNINCQGCPRGVELDWLPQKIMSFDKYKKVLDKLVREIPHLTYVELFSWGEPMLHPEIEKIVSYTESKLPSVIATNLTVENKIKTLLQARPSEVSVTVVGTKENYERLMKGASWKGLVTNLKTLSKYASDSTRLLIKAYPTRSDRNKAECEFRELSRETGVPVELGHLYPSSYDEILRFCAGSTVSPQFEQMLKELPWNFEKALQLSQLDKNKPCLAQRIFPMINADLSVGLCHVYGKPVLAENFLEKSFEELLELRHSEAHCTRCQEMGLHRLDLGVISRQHRQKYKDLYRNTL